MASKAHQLQQCSAMRHQKRESCRHAMRSCPLPLRHCHFAIDYFAPPLSAISPCHADYSRHFDISLFHIFTPVFAFHACHYSPPPADRPFARHAAVIDAEI